MIHGTKKLLLGVTHAKKILLYSPMLKWYLEHGLKITAIHKYLKYESRQPFSWFPEAIRQGLTETTIHHLHVQIEMKLVLGQDDRRSNKAPKNDFYN